MDLIFLLAAIAFLFVWHGWMKRQGTPPQGWRASEYAETGFVSDVAWLIFCAPIAVGLMLIGAAGLCLWIKLGGPAWSLQLLWPWCAAIVIGVGYHGWSRTRRS